MSVPTAEQTAEQTFTFLQKQYLLLLKNRSLSVGDDTSSVSSFVETFTNFLKKGPVTVYISRFNGLSGSDPQIVFSLDGFEKGNSFVSLSLIHKNIQYFPFEK